MTATPPQDAQPRRFLIATAVAHHQRSPEANRPGLVEARQKIIDLFTRRLGYTHVSDLGLDPDRNALLQHLDRFATAPDRRPEDIVAVYLAGHGQLIGSTPRRHMFFPADADLAKPKLALPTAQIAAALTDDTKLTQVLLILDTCYAGQGGGDAISAALESLRRSIDDDPSGIAVIASAQPAQQALEGALPDLLTAAVESRSIAGERPSTLDLGALVTHMNADPSRPATQRIEWDAARLTGDIPDFFPNPRHRAAPREVDLAIQHAAEWDAQARRRDTEFARRMLVRAMAHFGDREQWWFAGRHEVMAGITDWLDPSTPGRPGLVVTAGPGSGKTAVLGLTAALAHPEHRNTVPVHLLGLRPHQVPAVGSVDVAIYAQALTNDDVLRGLAAAVRAPVGVPGDLVEALAQWERPLTVIIDAVDEAATPDTLLTQLVRPLLEYGQGRIRLLLGTRPHLLRHLPSDVPVVDLDDPEHLDSRAIASYALRGLLDSRPESPYPDVPPRLSAEVAKAVAEAATPSFLVARIVSGTLAAQPSVADPTNRAWRTALPRTADAAMARDLDTRLGDDAVRARDLLRPLAYAEGQGLPWEDVWAPLASGIAGRTYTNDDLLWLKRNAGSYVVEAAEDGRSVYRLYHMALAEHLKRGCDDDAVQQAFVDVLVGGVPRTIDGQRDWNRTHPYTLRYLAAHAAHIGRVDELLQDCGYLALSEPSLLLHALHKVMTPRGRAVRTIYRASAGMHAELEPAQRRMVLAVDAMRHREAILSRELAAGHHWKPTWASGTQTSTALRATLIGHTGWVFAVACTVVKDVPVAVTGGLDGTARVWDLTTNAELRTLTGHEQAIDAVACAVVQGTPLAVTGSRDGTARLWDLTTGEQQAVLRGHGGRDGAVHAVAFTSVRGAPVVLTGGADGNIHVWDLNSLVLRDVLPAHSGFVQGIACTVVNGLPIAVSGGRDEWVKVWDLESGTERDAIPNEGRWVNGVACTDVEGKAFAVTSGEALRLWDLTGSGRHHELADGTRYVSVATAHVDGAPVVVAGGDEGPVTIWSLEGTGGPRYLGGHTNIVYSVACTEVTGDAVVVAAGYDKEVRLWDMEATVEPGDPGGHRALVGSMAWATHQGRPVLVTGAADGSTVVWDPTTGQVEASLSQQEASGYMALCAQTAGEPWVVTRDLHGETIRVRDAFTGAELGSWECEDINDQVRGCAELGGRRTLFVEAEPAHTVVIDLDTGSEKATLSGDPRSLVSTWVNGTQAVLFTRDSSPEGRTDGQPMGELWAWEPKTGVERLIADDVMAPVYSLAVTPGEGASLAVSGHADGEVRLWELSTGSQLSSVRTELGGVDRVAVRSVLGTVIVATAHANTVQVRDAHTGTVWDTWTLPYAVGRLSLSAAGGLAVATGHEVIFLEPRTSR